MLSYYIEMDAAETKHVKLSKLKNTKWRPLFFFSNMDNGLIYHLFSLLASSSDQSLHHLMHQTGSEKEENIWTIFDIFIRSYVRRATNNFLRKHGTHLNKS